MREEANGEWPVGGEGVGDAAALPAAVEYPLGAEHGEVREGAIRSDRDLRVWQEATDLAESVYRASALLSPDERSGLTSQLRRAAVSVPPNIAEGWGRGKTKERPRLLRSACASIEEIETQWLLTRRLDYIGDDTARTLEERSAVLGRRLLALMRALPQRRPA